MFGILDCTLRDGGYYTNWDFDDELVTGYLAALRTLPIDWVEIGYRNPAQSAYHGRYFHLAPEDVRALRAALRPDQGLALMLDTKGSTPERVTELLAPLRGTPLLVRFACPPTGLEAGIALARAAAAAGFETAMNVMYLSKYSRAIDQLAPLGAARDAVHRLFLVDSYGSCFPDEVRAAVAAAVALLPQPVGFHGHDNLSLAFANGLAALEGGATLLDATLTGMGRGAGNLATELIVAYRERSQGLAVDYRRLAPLLDRLRGLQKTYDWGTSLPYMISGLSGLPQAEVMDWLGKRRYTAASVIAALRSDEASGLDRSDHPTLATAPAVASLRGRPAVLIGGGPSALRHAAGLRRFLAATDAVVIHSSLHHHGLLRPGPAPQLFCLAGQEIARVVDATLRELDAAGALWVVPRPPRFPGSVPPLAGIYQVAPADGLEAAKLGPVSDLQPLELALQAAAAAGCSRVYLYGFDGYPGGTPSELEMMGEGQEALERFGRAHPGLPVSSLLPTLYRLPTESLYAPR